MPNDHNGFKRRESRLYADGICDFPHDRRQCSYHEKVKYHHSRISDSSKGADHIKNSKNAKGHLSLIIAVLMGILAICLVVIPSKEELFSEGIKKAVSNDLVDISIPPAKITGEEGKRKILYTVIVDNKSEYLMRDLKVYIRPEEMVRQNLLPYENEEYLMPLGHFL